MRSALYLVPLLLAACAGPIETRVESMGQTSAQPASFAINADASGPAASAQSVVAKRLTEKGYRQSEVAELNLQVSVSDRPAVLGLKTGNATLAPDAGKKLCAKRDYRVGVVLTRIADGVTVYNSHASEFHCKQTLDQVLPSLINAAMADLGAPRGSYSVKRPR